jgi:hypothetical protein
VKRYVSVVTAAALVCVFVFNARAEEEVKAGPYTVKLKQFASPAGKFSVLVPTAPEWMPRDRFPYQIDDTVTGIFLQGPVGGEGAAVKIAVLHYAGTGKIKGVDHYVRMVGFNPTRTDGTFDTGLSDIEVAGRKGKTFTFPKFELVTLPHEPLPEPKPGLMVRWAPPSKQVEMIDRYIVIPAGKGFYSLRYEAPKAMYDEYAGVFDAVVKSFTCTE